MAFAQQFATLATEILGAAGLPPIEIGIDSQNPTGVVDNNWTENVLADGLAIGFVPGFISDHNYMQAPGSENDSYLLNDSDSDPASIYDWSTRYADYESILSQTLGSQASNVAIFATEFYTVYNDPGKQSSSLVDGLFIANSIGSLLDSGYDGATTWDLRDSLAGQSPGNDSNLLYGWREDGSYGLLGDDPNGAAENGEYAAYPSYYAMQLASKIIVAGGEAVPVSSSYGDLDVYAVRESDGDLDLLVINTNPAANLSDQFNLTGFQPGGSAQVWQYGEAQDTAQSQTTDGSSALANFSTTLNLSGANFSYTFPPYSMTVLDLAPAPVLSGPSTAMAKNSLPLALSGANALSLSDAAASAATVDSVALSVKVGTLNVNLSGGATISAGANNTSSLTLSGTLLQLNSALATLTYLAPANGSSDTLTALAADGSNSSTPFTITITIVPVVATRLVVTSQPASTVTAGSALTFTVTAEDAQGDVATSFTGSETVTLASNPGGSTLSGTLTVSASGGIATFSGLSLNKVGAGYTVKATNGTLTSATSGSISVSPGATTQLLITTQPPATVTPGSSFGFTVTAEDAEGNIASGFNGSETVALVSNPGGNTLGGTLTISASSGVAIFSGLSLNNTGSGYTLAVASGTLKSSTSNNIAVDQAPTIISSAGKAFTSGAAGTFTVTAVGFPLPTLAEAGALPAGVTFNTTTGVLSVSATVVVGTYAIEFIAHNGSGSNATQAFMLTIAASSAAVSDSGFETPSVSSATGGSSSDPTGSPWTFSGTSGIAGNSSSLTTGNPNAPEGIQLAYLQGTGSMSQSIAFQAGTYVVTFDAAQSAKVASQQTIDVLIDGKVLGTVTPKNTTYEAYSSDSFTIATAGNHTLTFQGTLPSSGGSNTTFLDAVTITAGQPNQPFDPGFEDAAQGSGAAAYQYDPTGSPWTFNGYAGLAGNGSGFTANNPNAPQGGQVAFLQMTGSVSQSFNMVPGVYSVNLQAAERGVTQSGQTFEVLVDGQVVSTITPSGTSYASYTSGSFAIGAAGNHTLTFLGLDPFGGDNTILIDQVSVQNVTANQPIDPGFESPDLGTGPTAYQYDPTGSPWTFNGYAGVAGNGSGFTANNPNAPQGSQAAFIQMTGSASQMMTLAAGTYSVSLDAAQRNVAQPGQTIEVLVDNALVGTIMPGGTNYALYSTPAFYEPSGTHTVEILGLDPQGGDNTALSTRCRSSP